MSFRAKVSPRAKESLRAKSSLCALMSLRAKVTLCFSDTYLNKNTTMKPFKDSLKF